MATTTQVSPRDETQRRCRHVTVCQPSRRDPRLSVRQGLERIGRRPASAAGIQARQDWTRDPKRGRSWPHMRWPSFGDLSRPTIPIPPLSLLTTGADSAHRPSHDDGRKGPDRELGETPESLGHPCPVRLSSVCRAPLGAASQRVTHTKTVPRRGVIMEATSLGVSRACDCPGGTSKSVA
jgi:hypothetical protein